MMPRITRTLLLQLVAIAGLSLGLASCLLPWFTIPVDAEPLSQSPTAVEVAEPVITVAYRIATLAVLAALTILWRLGKTGSAGMALAVLWMAALLTYPYLVMNRDASIAGQATWLEDQHRNLVWSGGDLNMSVGHRAVGSLDNLILTPAPRNVNPIEIAPWLPSDWSLARLPDLVDRLGYSNKFFEFIRRGWIAAMAGGVFLLIAISAPQGRVDAGRFAHIAGLFTAVVLVLCLLGWGWSFAAARNLAAAAEHTARGEYQMALEAMRQAERRLPALSEDTYFIAQVGLLDDALGHATPEARLYRANLHERAGKSHQGDVAQEGIMNDSDAPAAVRREACRVLLRSAIDALNAGRANVAADRLQKVLAAEPCNLKANYALQLAYLRTGRYDIIPALAQRLDAVYHYFQYPSKLAVVSASYQNAVVADSELGNTESAVANYRKVVTPKS